MGIRLVSGCINCQNLQTENVCKIHNTKVESKHTCDSFDMQVSLRSETTCLNCSKYFTSKCPNQDKAAPDMLCNQWSPKIGA